MVKLLQLVTFDANKLALSGIEFMQNKALWVSPIGDNSDFVLLPDKHEFVIQLNGHYIEVFRRNRDAN